MKKLNIFLLNSLIAIAALGFAINYKFWWTLLLVFACLLVLLLQKDLIKWTVVLLLPSLLFVALYTSFVPSIVTFKSLFQLIDKDIPIRSGMMSYIDLHYDAKSRDFIYMLLFNVKDNKFYKDLIALNIAHLFVISGLHISIFCNVAKKIIKNEYAALTLNVVFTLFIFYLTGFSISIFRVLTALIVAPVVKKWELNSFQKTCISGWSMFLMTPLSCISYGYVLSMLCTLFITYVINETDAHWLQFILINLFTSIVILPISISFNGKFNILFFLNNILFSNIIIIIYYIELLTCWIPFMFTINSDMIHVIRSYMSALSQLQAFINVHISKIAIVLSYFIQFSAWNCYEYKQNVYNARNIIYNKEYANNS